MSLLLDALKRAEEAKRAKQPVDTDAALEGEPPRLIPAQKIVASEVAELSLQDAEDLVPAAPALRRSPGNAAIKQVAGAKFNAGDFPSELELEAAPVPYEVTPSKAAKADDARQRESAKMVFAAKQPSLQDSGRKRSKWLVPVLAVIFVVVSGAGWYVWNEVNKISRPATPMVARPSLPAATSPTATPPAPQTPGQAVADAAKTVPKVAEDASMPPLLPPPVKAVPLPPSSTAAVSGTALTERQALAKSLKEAPVAKEPPLALSRTNAGDTPAVNPALKQAYDALRAGELRQAKAGYSQALMTSPNNLDAHLGMATAAARLGETALAIRHYRDALEIDPRNGTAIAGLLTLSGQGSGPTEVELKTLISRNPDAASLQFALGNLYSGERRWVEAQQAYFEAFRLDPDVPDYVYNLAVSLDQLRQVSLARQYYQRSLAMIGKSAGQFDKDAVIRRIQDLSRDSPSQGQAGNGTTTGTN